MGFSTRGIFDMRLISVLKCHAVTLVLRASPLNWALGAVRNFLVQISNFSLVICSSFSAIWLCLLKFLNHSTRKTCQSFRVASFSFVIGLLLVSWAQIAASLSVVETGLLVEISP